VLKLPALVSALVALCVGQVWAGRPPCEVPDNGSGTVDLPPMGCGYLSPQDVHMIIDGLPVGTTVRVGAEHTKFFGVMRRSDPATGGEIEQFNSLLLLDLQGTGMLNGFSRFVSIQVQCETRVGPRMAGDPVQSFDTEMLQAMGQIVGDPDFDLLRVSAGSGFGLPSPGHTTLRLLPSGNWNVDSFFDITYRIDFIGTPGGPLSGRSGSTTATIRMQTPRGLSGPTFRRGDANGDGRVDISDTIFGLNFQFRGGPAPGCDDAADANDDGRIDISDTIFGLNFQFRGGSAPPPPGPTICGADPTADPLTCDSFPNC
jgi:hypothetical protein